MVQRGFPVTHSFGDLGPKILALCEAEHHGEGSAQHHGNQELEGALSDAFLQPGSTLPSSAHPNSLIVFSILLGSDLTRSGPQRLMAVNGNSHMDRLRVCFPDSGCFSVQSG